MSYEQAPISVHKEVSTKAKAEPKSEQEKRERHFRDLAAQWKKILKSSRETLERSEASYKKALDEIEKYEKELQEEKAKGEKANVHAIKALEMRIDNARWSANWSKEFIDGVARPAVESNEKQAEFYQEQLWQVAPSIEGELNNSA